MDADGDDDGEADDETDDAADDGNDHDHDEDDDDEDDALDRLAIFRTAHFHTAACHRVESQPQGALMQH